MSWTSQFSGSVERAIAAPVLDVWAVVSDLEAMGERSPECRRIEWLDEAEPRPGVRFRGRNRLGPAWSPLRWSTICTIECWEPGRRLCFRANHLTGASTRWSYDLAAVGGRTVLTESFQTVDSPGFVLVLDRLAGRVAKLHRDMASTLEAIEREALRQRSASG